MSIVEFWEHGLSPDQQQLVDTLAKSLRPAQALWLSGYFAGFERAARAGVGPAAGEALGTSVPAAAEAVAPLRTLTVLYASETGNSAALAKDFVKAAGEAGLPATLCDVAAYKTRNLKGEQDLIIISSTHGEGNPPQPAVAFFEFLEGRKAPKLNGVRYAVLALGDSTYEIFCGAGKRLDSRLAELGATALEPRLDCDVDYDQAAAGWIKKLVATLAPAAAPASARAVVRAVSAEGAASPASAPVFDKRRPFMASVIDNLVLTGRGSSKETRHIELSVADSGLQFEPGDALGVLPRNRPSVVSAILESLKLGTDTPVTVGEQSTTLGEALSRQFEITAATPRFIDNWAELSGADALKELRGENNASARAAFLRENHIVDIIRRFPVKGVGAEAFLKGLRPLQPRLYSIASSHASLPDEVHLTVAAVRYALYGEPRFGVASDYLAIQAEPDTEMPVYVQSNPHFRLPEDDKPILMIGAGTGVAPYRAFLQEREVRGVTGKSWLVFGERNFRTDFLYQTEWQDFLKEGVLSRMNVAFSRDTDSKVYVQHRLKEQARDVYAWLEEGAHVYVCGDASHLAPDVHTILGDIVAEEGGMSRAAATDYLGQLQQDHRYQVDAY
jgi:sulfite reductase (NADPH) flavoprotein alpha-component